MPPRYGRKRRHFWKSGIIQRDRAGAARRRSKLRTGAKMESYLGESSGRSPRRTPVMPTSTTTQTRTGARRWVINTQSRTYFGTSPPPSSEWLRPGRRDRIDDAREPLQSVWHFWACSVRIHAGTLLGVAQYASTQER